MAEVEKGSLVPQNSEQVTVSPFNRVSSKSKVPPLKELLEDEEVSAFYQFVHANDLRVEALELLERRLGET